MRRDEFPIVEEYCKDKIIEELEKVKAESKELAFLFDDLSPDKELVVDLDNIEEVIDKHISELKGIVDRIEEPVKKALSALKGEDK